VVSPRLGAKLPPEYDIDTLIIKHRSWSRFMVIKRITRSNIGEAGRTVKPMSLHSLTCLVQSTVTYSTRTHNLSILQTLFEIIHQHRLPHPSILVDCEISPNRLVFVFPDYRTKQQNSPVSIASHSSPPPYNISSSMYESC
jgi:hypothetical protein